MLIRYDSINTQRQRDKQRLTDLERNLNDERQNKQRLESQIKTEKTVTKSLQDALTKLSLTPAKFVSDFFFSFFFIEKNRCLRNIFRNECTEQCLKRKRDFENETREIRRLLTDRDERIKSLENEIKVKFRETNS